MRAATIRGLSRSPTAGVFWTGRIRKYGLLNGTAGSYFSTPDGAAVSVTGDIDLRAYCSADTWTPSGARMLIAKDIASGGQRTFQFYVFSDGKLYLDWSANGSTFISKGSTVATNLAAFASKWVRVTLDVNNGSGSNELKFYTSDDGITWSQLGDTVITAGTTSLYDSTAQLSVGAWGVAGATNPWFGRIFRAQVYNGINGTIVADFDPARYFGGSTFTASTGEVWTVNGSAKILVQEL